MPPSITVRNQPDTGERRAARQDARERALEVLWTESTLRRQRDCGRKLAPGNTDGVQVRVSQAEDGCRTVGFGGLVACGSVWTCPVCASKIAAVRQREVAQCVAAAFQLGYGVLHLTLTMRHRAGQRLSTLWDAKSDAWKAARSGRAWLDEQELYGLQLTREVKTGHRAGQLVTEARMPTLSVTEVTYGENGWHVHVHALVFLAHQVGEQTAEVIGRQMFGRWSTKLQSLGLDAPTDRHGFSVRPVVAAESDVFGEYFTKGQYSDSTTARGAAAEMVQGHAKRGRGDNRTPFQVLASVYETGDVEDLAVWGEWERGSHKRRQLTWSPGLRELLGLVDVELEDEEIAEQECGGATVVVITADAWYGVIVRRRLRGELKRVAALGDVELFRWCHGHGVGFHVPEPDTAAA